MLILPYLTSMPSTAPPFLTSLTSAPSRLDLLVAVDKFTVWQQGEAVAWGITKAKIDVSAEEFFARLWVLTTYKKKSEHKKAEGSLPRGVWEDLDGTRSLQVRVCEERSEATS